MNNECIPLYEDAHRLTGHCEAAVTGKRFVAISDDLQGAGSPGLTTDVGGGNIQISPATAAGDSLGVASHDGAIGSKVTVLCSPLSVPIIAQGGITAGQEVEVGTTGRAKALDAGKARGKALNTAADGEEVFVRLYD